MLHARRLWVALGILGSITAIGLTVARRRRTARARPPSARSMVVDAIDELSLEGGLARPMHGPPDPDGHDPDDVPTEHPELHPRV